MPDTDLEISRGGGAVIQTLRQGGGGQSLFLRPLVPQSGLKIRGEPRPPGPSPRSATATFTPHKDHKVIYFCLSVRNMNGWGGGRGEGGEVEQLLTWNFIG